VQAAERARADESRSAARERPKRLDPDPSPAKLELPERIALSAIATGGAALPADVRADMEARLGADFSAVRLHLGEAAAQSAEALEAEAYTVGNDVVFARGAFAPHDALGRLRLAHELTHVLQQRSGAAGGAGVSDPADPLERAAEGSARAALARPRPVGLAHKTADAATVSGARIIQRRAVLDRSPAREAASDAAADSPWLGMTAPGMIDFRTSTPTVTPATDTPTPGPARAGPDGRADAEELDRSPGRSGSRRNHRSQRRPRMSRATTRPAPPSTPRRGRLRRTGKPSASSQPLTLRPPMSRSRK
jgi:uncharacterized protein DUF4157